MDSGSDVDRYDLFGDGEWKRTPLASFQSYDTKAHKETLKRSLVCRSHLLQAGADPTLQPIAGTFTEESIEPGEPLSMARETMMKFDDDERLMVSSWTS